jgi:hypothetical protein
MLVQTRWKVGDTSGRCSLVLLVVAGGSSLLLCRRRMHCSTFERGLKD